MDNKYNIIFMGTPEFARNALEKLVDKGHKILSVFSQAPKPVGRKQIVCKSMVHEFAEKNGIDVFTPKSLKNDEIQGIIRSQSPDLIIVAAYGFIIPQVILDMPKFGCINIHASLLPRWRGAAPIQHAIMAGDTKTGVTIMQMDAGMDTGNIILKKTIDITNETTGGSLTNELSVIGANAICEVLADLENYLQRSYKQPSEGVTIAPKITKEVEMVDWHKNAVEIERIIRALNPAPAMWSAIDGTRIKILEAEVVQLSGAENLNIGTLVGKSFIIKCGDDTYLKLNKIQPAGKKIMNAADFLNGHKDLIGKIFDDKIY